MERSVGGGVLEGVCMSVYMNVCIYYECVCEFMGVCSFVSLVSSLSADREKGFGLGFCSV